MRKIYDKVKETLEKHHETLWWAHSIYALALGIAVVVLAHRKFHLVKWLILSLFGLWIGLLLFNRFLAGRAESAKMKGVKVVFNYIMKNLYQQMFFFMIPFYYDTTTFGSINMWFLLAIAVCAVLSTQDIIFDRYIMENRYLASFFYAFCLFASFNIFLPLLFGVKNIVAVYLSGVFCIILFSSLHFPVRQLLSRMGAIALVVAICLFLVLLGWGRRGIPPAPIRQVASTMAAGRDPGTGKPVGRFYRIHADDLKSFPIYCFTTIETPLAIREDIRHLWFLRGKEVYRRTFTMVHSKTEKGVDLYSRLERFPPNPVGEWVVEARTTGDQLIGLTRFLVVR